MTILEEKQKSKQDYLDLAQGELNDIHSILKFFVQAITNDDQFKDERFSLESDKDLYNFIPMLEVIYDKTQKAIEHIEDINHIKYKEEASLK